MMTPDIFVCTCLPDNVFASGGADEDSAATSSGFASGGFATPFCAGGGTFRHEMYSPSPTKIRAIRIREALVGRFPPTEANGTAIPQLEERTGLSVDDRTISSYAPPDLEESHGVPLTRKFNCYPS